MGKKIRSILRKLATGFAIVPISFRLTAKHRLAWTGSDVGGTVGEVVEYTLLEQILFIFFFFSVFEVSSRADRKWRRWNSWRSGRIYLARANFIYFFFKLLWVVDSLKKGLIELIDTI